MAQLVFECNREMTGFSKFAKISANRLFLCDIYMRFLTWSQFGLGPALPVGLSETTCDLPQIGL